MTYMRNGACRSESTRDRRLPLQREPGCLISERGGAMRFGRTVGSGAKSRGVGARAIRPALLAIMVAWGLTGCGTDDGATGLGPQPPAEEVPEGDLLFLRQSGNAPPLLTRDTTFVATRGEDLKIELFYEPEPGSDDDTGERFLEFELDKESLLRYPNGHPRAGQTFADGDTITIRIRVDEAESLATLEPSGLEFEADRPAELELRYGNADDDYDEDGDSDPELEDDIDLWRQEQVGDPWTRVGELKDADEDKIRAFLTSFSRYALAI